MVRWLPLAVLLMAAQAAAQNPTTQPVAAADATYPPYTLIQSTYAEDERVTILAVRDGQPATVPIFHCPESRTKVWTGPPGSYWVLTLGTGPDGDISVAVVTIEGDEPPVPPGPDPPDPDPPGPDPPDPPDPDDITDPHGLRAWSSSQILWLQDRSSGLAPKVGAVFVDVGRQCMTGELKTVEAAAKQLQTQLRVQLGVEGSADWLVTLLALNRKLKSVYPPDGNMQSVGANYINVGIGLQ